MKTTAKVLSLIALAATIVPCMLFAAGSIGHEMVKWIALLGTIVWFVVTPAWMGRDVPIDAAEVEI